MKNDPTLTEDDVSAYCKQHLITGYKRPKKFKFAMIYSKPTSEKSSGLRCVRRPEGFLGAAL
ncbi:MAG TPA: hypothetical protein DCP03_00910 [Polaromonas sp.]|nr:hypothetical protein [Polaromonas sp.]